MKRWLDDQPSGNTRAAYAQDVSDFAEWCRGQGVAPLAATTEQIGRYRDDQLASGLSAASVSRRLSGLSSFYRHAAQSAAVPSNPVDDVERPAIVAPDATVLEEHEVESMVRAANELGPKAVALVSMLALDGMKLGETLDLDVPEVTRRRSGVTVAVNRRGRRHELRLDSRTAAAVVSYLGPRRTGPVFLGDSPTAETSTRLTRFGADFIVKRAGAAAGLDKKVSASVLRRSYMAAAHRAGVSIEAIQQQVGHGDRRTTARFVEGGGRGQGRDAPERE